MLRPSCICELQRRYDKDTKILIEKEDDETKKYP